MVHNMLSFETVGGGEEVSPQEKAEFVGLVVCRLLRTAFAGGVCSASNIGQRHLCREVVRIALVDTYRRPPDLNVCIPSVCRSMTSVMS